MRSGNRQTNEQVSDDRSTPARIRDAALTLFADAGVASVGVRRIATEAGVSPGLVIHHFGSKDGLRAACDEYVAATVREQKQSAMSAGPDFDPLGPLRGLGEGPPLLRYLARTLVDGSPPVAKLVDEIALDAADYMADGVEAGALKASEFPRERAVIMTLWTLGALVLHEHLDRLLGVDLMKGRLEPGETAAYFAPALEILGQGVLSNAAYEQFRSAFDSANEAGRAEGESK